MRWLDFGRSVRGSLWKPLSRYIQLNPKELQVSTNVSPGFAGSRHQSANRSRNLDNPTADFKMTQNCDNANSTSIQLSGNDPSTAACSPNRTHYQSRHSYLPPRPARYRSIKSRTTTIPGARSDLRQRSQDDHNPSHQHKENKAENCCTTTRSRTRYEKDLTFRALEGSI